MTLPKGWLIHMLKMPRMRICYCAHLILRCFIYRFTAEHSQNRGNYLYTFLIHHNSNKMCFPSELLHCTCQLFHNCKLAFNNEFLLKFANDEYISSSYYPPLISHLSSFEERKKMLIDCDIWCCQVGKIWNHREDKLPGTSVNDHLD